MTTKTGFILVICAFICAGVWMGLPMSVFSETHPTATIVLKIAGTVIGLFGIGAVIWERIKDKSIF